MEIQTVLPSSIQPAQAPAEIESAREDARDTGSERSETTRSSNQTNSPAVIANISASALAASRADNSTNPTDAQAQTNTAIAVEIKNQTTPSNEQLSSSGKQTLQTSRVDTVA